VKKAIVLAFLGGAAVVCLAQSHRFPPIDLYTGDPTGNACTGNIIQQSSTTGLIYSCQAGTMKGTGGPGNASISGQTTGFIPKAATATSLTSPSHLDDGVTTANTVTSSVNVAVTGTVVAKNIVRNVLTFGADPTNTTDSSSAFMSCLQAGVGCYVPPGSYKISATIRFPNCSGSNKSVSLWGDPGSSPNGYPAILNIAAGVTAFAPACPLTAYQTISFKYFEIKGGKNGIDFGLAGITDIDHITFWDYTGWGVTHIIGEKHRWSSIFCWHQTVVAQGCISLDDPTKTQDAAVYAADAYWSIHSGFMDRIDIDGLIDQGNSTTVNDAYTIHSAGAVGTDAGEGVVGNFRIVKPLIMWAGATRVFEFLGDLNIGSIEQPGFDIIGRVGVPASDLLYVGGSVRMVNMSRFTSGYAPDVIYTNGINIRTGVVNSSITDSTLGGDGSTFWGVRIGTPSTGGNQLRISNSSGYLFQEGANTAFANGTVSIIGGLMKSNLTAGFVAPGSGNGFDYQFYLPANGGTDNCSNWAFTRSKPSVSSTTTDLSMNCTSVNAFHPFNIYSDPYFNGSTNVASRWTFTPTNTGGAGNNMTLTLAPTNPGTGTSPGVTVAAAVSATGALTAPQHCIGLSCISAWPAPNGAVGGIQNSLFMQSSATPVLTKGGSYGGWTADAFAAPAFCWDGTRYVMTASLWSVANSKWASAFYTSSNLKTWSYVASSLQSPSGGDYIWGNSGLAYFNGLYYLAYTHYASGATSRGVTVATSSNLTTWTTIYTVTAGASEVYGDPSLNVNQNTGLLELWMAHNPSNQFALRTFTGTTWTDLGDQVAFPSDYAGGGEPSVWYSGTRRYIAYDAQTSGNHFNGFRLTKAIYTDSPYTTYLPASLTLNVPTSAAWQSAQVFDASVLMTDSEDGNGMGPHFLYAGADINSSTDNTDSSLGYGYAALAAGGYVGAAPTTPVQSGSAGQYSVDSNYFYAYDATNLLWRRAAWDASWTSNIVATPQYSPDAGSYSTLPSVTITDATSGSAISYCLDLINTCTPTTAYTVPVAVSNNNYLRALATKSGATTSPIKSALYTLSTYQVQDLFADTAGTQLTAHTTIQGQSWVGWSQHSGDLTSWTTVTLNGSGSVANSHATLQGSLYVNMTPSSVSYTVCATGVASVQNFGVGEVSTSADTGYRTNWGSGTMTLYAASAGTYTSKGTFAYSWSGSHTQCLVRSGTSISVTIDGSTVIGPVTDSTYTSVGVPLLTIGKTSSVSVTSFTVQ
jgi:hypothetical protein